jgi:hypothetical protein
VPGIEHDGTKEWTARHDGRVYRTGGGRAPYHFQLESSVGFAIREKPQGLSAATFIVTQPQRDESVMGRADPLDG